MTSREVRVRGMLVLAQRAIMERIAGREEVAAAIAEVADPVLRLAYTDASVLSWVPQPAVREVTRQVALRMGISPVSLAEQVVRLSVTELCQGPWNVLLRMASDEALVSRAASLFARSFDAGAIETKRLGEGLVELTLSGWPDAQEMDLASVSAGVMAALSAVGRRSEVVRQLRPSGAVYTVRVG